MKEAVQGEFLAADPRLVVLVSQDRQWRQRLSRCVGKLGLPSKVYEDASPHRRGLGVVYCLDVRSALKLKTVLPPAVIVYTGSSVPSNLLPYIAQPGVVTMDLATISPQRLLDAIVQATLGVSTRALEAYLASVPHLSNVSLYVVEAFLRAPRRMRSHVDLCRALQVSRTVARRALHEMGFTRAEHLWTALRAEAWRWFVTQGINRAVFEDYLGITDQSTFRRSCERAGVEPPWHQAS